MSIAPQSPFSGVSLFSDVLSQDSEPSNASTDMSPLLEEIEEMLMSALEYLDPQSGGGGAGAGAAPASGFGSGSGGVSMPQSWNQPPYPQHGSGLTSTGAGPAQSSPVGSVSHSGSGSPGKVNLSAFSDLQLPVGQGGRAQDIHGDISQVHNQFFQQNANGSVTFSVPDGDTAKNQGSSYPRSELSENGSWHMGDGTATMSATLQIDKLPHSGDIVIGQIHEREGADGKPRPPLELHYDNGKIVASVMDNNNSATAGRQNIVIATNVKPGQPFSYSLSLAKNGKLNIEADGQSKSVQLSSSFAQSDLYFKAGNYTQDGSAHNGGSAVTFSGLNITHTH